MIADLHIHTTASDGKLTPAHTVAWAKNRGIEVMSVTDHDSVDGLDEAEAEAKRQGIRFVRGIELSSFWIARYTYSATICKLKIRVLSVN